MSDVAGKTVIVTGAANGIGRCLSEKLVKLGANVVAVDKDKMALDQLRADLSVPGYDCDISDIAEVLDVVEVIYEAHKPLSVLVNNAAVIYSAPLLSIKRGFVAQDAEEWDAVIGTNLSGTFYMTGAVVAKMVEDRASGVVVNVGSISAGGNPGQGAYSASKAGLEAATLAWAREMYPLHIRMACIAPGFTDTERTRTSLSKSALDLCVKRTLAKRLGMPEEIADGILFIIANDFFSGRVLHLDGGSMI